MEMTNYKFNCVMLLKNKKIKCEIKKTQVLIPTNTQYLKTVIEIIQD